MASKSSLTILFENPFWIGLYEHINGDKYEVCKITFGAEPRDYEVYDFLLKNWHRLNFSPPIKTDKIEERKINPKRMQREINSQLENRGIGTQQALKLQHEQGKIERKVQSREQKEAEKERQYAIRQEKKKAKHRGR